MPTALTQLGLTPAKAVAILLLGGLLAVIWGPQLMPATKSASRPSQATLVSSKSTESSPAKIHPAGIDPASITQQIEYPRYEVEVTALNNPFALPDWTPEKPRRQVTRLGEAPIDLNDAAERFEALRSTGVSMLLVSSNGGTATIGDQTLRVGDEIDGFRVVSISSEGVLLKPQAADSQPDGERPTNGT